ncbi:MAG: glycosyltransferase, partial [Pseudomonadota bacterium]
LANFDYQGLQITNLEMETSPPLRVLVRDDQSTDSTPLVLRHWAEDWSAIHLLPDDQQKRGATGSFQHLIRTVRADEDSAPLVAFCDQDDEWLPEKLERAAQWHQDLGDPSQPALYCSRARLANANLEPFGYSPLWPRSPSFPNALVENIALGCTIVLNRAALALLDHEWPPGVITHDWWAYLRIIGAGGVVHVDPEPSLLYRQHGRNAIGMASNPIGQFVNRVKRLSAGRMPALFGQAAALQAVDDGALTPDAQAQLVRFLQLDRGGDYQFSPLFSNAFHRQRRVDGVMLRLMMAFGRIS